MENRCICCGEIIPEGRQVCTMCEAKAERRGERHCYNCQHYDEDAGEKRRLMPFSETGWCVHPKAGHIFPNIEQAKKDLDARIFREKVYDAATFAYGFDAQQVVAIEELSELQKEICKALRGKGDIDHIAEEVADATIMLEQLRHYYEIDEAVQKHMDAKIDRLAGRIERYLKVERE